ncbi:sugar phosphate isomerase/epimerase family protein [Meiothermus taiwanensis]|jgi:sugar phosphate isomerase/epimerase|uniref:Xylose isomerase-like TIM barrel n=2 Tax=Meiothermus taiwanensis TaxID=172827 RepID=A0A399E1E8_9DEIN|nr:sugar phosphate isomerase/epimerase family protein [Meiothermus taiwanensis]AWR87761.1 xylose isomerase [Meiothermus taiwanensis WR-220]KIQ54711.1 endonuclease IV [Meiothermus taiwanensis]KZK15193.1 endonuclease IV [Meiothermus taiwanensis]RIH77856.1 Xylose isomerase-like TIM barrel [Meiothermus taiwanensis]
MKPPLPVLGLALPIERLPEFRSWFLEHGGRDLELQDAVRPEVLDGDWQPLVALARQALEGYTGRMGIHGPYDGLWMASFDPFVRRMIAERYRRALEFAADLGASHMVIHSPFLFFGHPQMAHAPGNGLEREIEWVHDTLRTVLPLARNLGLVLVIENIRDTNPQPLRTLVQSFGSEHVRMSLDVGHAHLMQQLGGPAPDQWVKEAGPLLAHLHLQDNDGLLDRHWSPGQGGINWRALFAALEALQSRPRLILEVRHEQLPVAAQWLLAQGLAC